jgi:CubicO group peptidase (beta-lactamase class C family)
VLAAAVAVAAGCDGPGLPAGKADTPPAPPSASPSPSTTRDVAAFTAAVDAMAAEALERGPVAGLSIAVVERGLPLLVKGYGQADVEAGVAATPRTSYPVASVSKHVTAALVLRLVDQGKLGLEDPLSRFFPTARPAIGALTVRHLLDHTSGLTKGGPAPRAAALSVVRRGGTARTQGEDWDYSNYNYSLLGLVIEQVTGRSYADYVRDEVSARLGLAGTGYCEDGTAVPGRGRDYQSGYKSVTPTLYWTQAKFFASGGLCSTVEDLVAWEKALEDGRVVSPAMLAAMRTPSRLPDGAEADYGFGTRLGRTGTHRKLGHTGGGQSNKAVLARYPDDDVTIAVLLNTERHDATVAAADLEDRIGRLLFDVPAAAPLGPASGEDLRGLTGRYRDGPRIVDLAAAEGGLCRKPGPRGKAAGVLVPQGDGVFLDPDDPSFQLRFQRADGAPPAYNRYHYGWFVGLGVRGGAVPTVSAERRRPSPSSPTE